MKKTKVMRLLSLLLVMTLISTCAISGTFAKYVTRASGTDEARVAKWGILVSVNGNTAFSNQYETDDTDAAATIQYSVVSEDDAKVVAPGTTNPEPALAGSVSGKAEVAVRYTLEISDFTDVVLPAGTYTDYTELVKADDGTYGYTGTFDLSEDYGPVKWDIRVTSADGSKSISLVEKAAQYGQTFDGFSFTDAASIIQAQNIMDRLLPELERMGGGHNATAKIEDGKIIVSMDFDPNVDMGYTFELTWKWAFEQVDFDLYDKADTYIGLVAAGEVADPAVTTTIGAKVTATAVQID